MSYKKRFNPKDQEDFRSDTESGGKAVSVGDQREGEIYLYNEDIVLAINIALATGRPLLLKGPSGCGKSSLVANVARVFDCRYYEAVITSRTKARDLLWHFDSIRRLGDAQLFKTLSAEQKQGFHSNAPYINPGVLWWAFDRADALKWLKPRGEKVAKISDPSIKFPSNDSTDDNGTDEIPPKPSAVVLLDEIDKADPDIPNDLLVVLGSLQFDVTDVPGSHPVKFQSDEKEPEDPPLVIITTNGERELPNTFLRRCIVLDLKPPTENRLIKIAKANFGEENEKNQGLYKKVYDVICKQNPALNSSKHNGSNPKASSISIAEYLDTVQAAMNLEVAVDGDEQLRAIVAQTIWKR